MASVVRSLFGFILACLCAGMVIVMFVKTPTQLLETATSERVSELTNTGMLILAAATQSAIFAAPFAAVAVLLGALLRYRNAFFYVFTGLAISILGFAILHMGETANAGTILNPYAAAAYTCSGLAGGIVYWLLAGRYIGSRTRTKKT